MKTNPLKIACFRFEIVSPLIQKDVTKEKRLKHMKVLSEDLIKWPTGRMGRVGTSTLYRWIKAYDKNPDITSLMPKERVQKKRKCVFLSEWTDYALALLEENPDRSLYLLQKMLQNKFELSSLPPKSSFHRALKKEWRYQNIKRKKRGGQRKLRRRFQAENPHDIWHADGKGEFDVQFTDGSKKTLKVLSILDDASRFILSAKIIKSESIATAVATFRDASARYGLPEKFYADRGSAYDSYVFREGLAVLGVHRIETKPGNPEAHGKIEVYHRSLKAWFIKELRHQPVLDLRHLQDLLDASIDQIFNDHKHREIKMKPSEALNGQKSKRQVSLQRLKEIFLKEKEQYVDLKTGMVRVNGLLYQVPKPEAYKKKAHIAVDPETKAAYLIRKPRVFIPLELGIKKAGSKKPKERSLPRGSLSPLLNKYQGRSITQSRPGFGLPEIYEMLSKVVGRKLPSTEVEATLITGWLKQDGPFDPNDLQKTLDKTLQKLGSGRALSQIIDHLINIQQDTLKRSQNEKD